jgi:capsular polysaccharide export protein
MRRHIAKRYIKRFHLPEDCLYVWGHKKSGVLVRKRAGQASHSLKCLEDGFLRSVGLGGDTEPWSVCVDDIGIYYDATTTSWLELLIKQPLEKNELERAIRVKHSWTKLRLSKYNGARDSPTPSSPFVLVVDQTAGDLSIEYGLANRNSFHQMLEAALNDWPDHQIVIKIHPDVVAGRKLGHFSKRQLDNPRIRVCSDGGHPCSLLEGCTAVYVVTSQLGFEGLLWGKEVHVFGMPFYAGWGLTQDLLAAPARRVSSRPTLEKLIHAALIEYPRYINPETGQPCEVELIMQWISLQHSRMMQFPDHIEAFGFTPWKARQLRKFMPRSKAQTLHFRRRHSRPSADAQAAIVWGRRESRGLQKSSIQTIRVEDGFIRSVGLGSNLVDPQSWVFDRSGIYYDASSPSDIETMLRKSNPNAEERARASRLKAKLIETRITKYNLGGSQWERPEPAKDKMLLLVLGQVEGDASIRFGIPPDSNVQTNKQLLDAARRKYPEAWIIYKPHPDIVAGLRAESERFNRHTRLWDQLEIDADINTLLDQVDRVCVMTSLGGFEALLRDVPVTTWGLPFYAGWQLSDDELLDHPWIAKRRGRKLDMEMLIHECLIQYPTYISNFTKQQTQPESVIEDISQATATSIQMTTEQRIFRWWGAARSRIFSSSRK